MKQVQKPRKPLIVYYLIAIAVLILFNSFVFPAIVGGNVEEVDYGTFLTMVENKEVSKVQLEGESIYFTDKSEDSRRIAFKIWMIGIFTAARPYTIKSCVKFNVCTLKIL